MTDSSSSSDTSPPPEEVEGDLGSPVERQSTRTVSPPSVSRTYDYDRPGWRLGNRHQRPCVGRHHTHCDYCTDVDTLRQSGESHNGTVSRFGAGRSQQALVYRGSMPTSWTSPSRNYQGGYPNQGPLNGRFGGRSQTADLSLEVPRLTRTQRSYINASPPSAREALTMRFIKANMSRRPSQESGCYTPRSESISQGVAPLMRNSSAPVTGGLSRTTSIQPHYADDGDEHTPPTAYVSRRGSRYGTQQRQISEPVGLRGVQEHNASAMQHDIEALNRALHEFQHNFTISPRGARDGRVMGYMENLESERVSEVHSRYGPIFTEDVDSSYERYLMDGANTPRGEMDDDEIEYGVAEELYYEDMETFDVEPEIMGLPDDIISQFPVTEFDAVAAGTWNEDARQCSICLEGYEQDQLIRRLACTHGYHKGCIDEWLSRSTVCPICKFDYRIMM
ncbi:zinc C3HC4 type RING finger domain-containing protein [Babesia ovis]|uniref:Zinc C3HC4 type RING finger domain-containing protein n=1 Tax=Babesia ovis TaxID=5869 RepID=A0A9W5TCP8_BABOV|nr:zinc C3HC4 type RING finger domain-containing protein [Babesia ovis]